MTVDEYLHANTTQLSEAGISSARLDVLILLEDATGKDRAWLLAHPEHGLDPATIHELDKRVSQRKSHMPLAYIRQRTEFYGRTFYVDAHVLEPRPETETMIELLKGLELPERPVIADVGTGSGAIAITAKLELPHASIYATDIDPACLAVAQRNAHTLRAEVNFMVADLLQCNDTPLAKPDVILTNLPYVPDDFTINEAAMNEPRLAIFGGPDGLNLYRRLFQDCLNNVIQPAYILCESLPPQHGMLAEIAATAGYHQMQRQDFIQVFKRQS